MNKTGFVICTRTDSERLPNKPFRKINGVPVMDLLIRRLQKTNIPVYISFPKEQKKSYEYLKEFHNVYLHEGDHYSDPLGRMHQCAKINGLETIIRVSHDKILVDDTDVAEAIKVFTDEDLDYLYGSNFIPGTGFEIISFKSLEKAAKKYKNVEYIGFSIRSVTDKIVDFKSRQPRGNYRFLIDYETDLKFFDVLFSQVGNDATLGQCIKYLNQNSEINQINAYPILTVYTCVYNGDEWIERCMESVARQTGFKNCEYIIIDDHSSDKTCESIAKFALKHKNVTWFRNEKNLGLSSSSNIALKKARGKYIIRLDADDYFVSVHALNYLLKEIQKEDLEAVYPDNYFGNLNTIQKGNEKHHVGGTIFDKNAINHIKFTDGLTNHDSLDIFLRAKDQLKIGYLEKPMFFYFQRENSMSRTNLKERQKIEEDLINNFELSGFDDADSFNMAEIKMDYSQ